MSSDHAEPVDPIGREDPRDLSELFDTPDPSVPHLRDFFTDAEIIAAYRVVYPEDVAHRHASALIRALDARLPMGLAPDTIDLLASVPPDGARRVREYLHPGAPPHDTGDDRSSSRISSPPR